jgi:hypothetical protein
MTFDRVQYNGRALILHPPLTLTPHLDQESGQLYVATDERLGVHMFAQTREQLAEELAEQLLFLWEAYALEDPARLTGSARQLRNELRHRVVAGARFDAQRELAPRRQER